MQTKIVKDMAKYTGNVFMGLSGRQTVLICLGVAIIAIAYFFLPIPGFLAIVMGLPFFLMAFYKPEGLSLERYAFYYIESVLRNSHTRYYEKNSEVYKALWGE
mgnify:CR=1 FL=1